MEIVLTKDNYPDIKFNKIIIKNAEKLPEKIVLFNKLLIDAYHKGAYKGQQIEGDCLNK